MKRRVSAVIPPHARALRVPERLLPAGRTAARPRTSAGVGPARLPARSTYPRRAAPAPLLPAPPSPPPLPPPLPCRACTARDSHRRLRGGQARPLSSLSPAAGRLPPPFIPFLNRTFPSAPQDDEAADAAAGAVSAGGALARRPPPLLLRGEEEVGGGGSRGAHAGGKEGARAIPLGCSRRAGPAAAARGRSCRRFSGPPPHRATLKVLHRLCALGGRALSLLPPRRGAHSATQPLAGTVPSVPLPASPPGPGSAGAAAVGAP